MWPQQQIRDLNQNPFPFFPFDPRWGEELPATEFEIFCALLRLAWASPRPCYLPADPVALNQMLNSEPETTMRAGPPQLFEGHNFAPVNQRILSLFCEHPETGLLYFPPQLRALERLVNGENMYALLWDGEMKR
jgi:hypothetical protein